MLPLYLGGSTLGWALRLAITCCGLPPALSVSTAMGICQLEPFLSGLCPTTQYLRLISTGVKLAASYIPIGLNHCKGVAFFSSGKRKVDSVWKQSCEAYLGWHNWVGRSVVSLYHHVLSQNWGTNVYLPRKQVNIFLTINVFYLTVCYLDFF